MLNADVISIQRQCEIEALVETMVVDVSSRYSRIPLRQYHHQKATYCHSDQNPLDIGCNSSGELLVTYTPFCNIFFPSLILSSSIES